MHTEVSTSASYHHSSIRYLPYDTAPVREYRLGVENILGSRGLHGLCASECRKLALQDKKVVSGQGSKA